MLYDNTNFLYHAYGDEFLHFIAGSNKTGYCLSNNEVDYYRVDINKQITNQKINSLTWKYGDEIRIIKKKNYGNWYNVIGSQAEGNYTGAQLECKFPQMEPKHWLSPLPNLLPDEQFNGLIRSFNGCTTLETVCDYLFVNMPHSNNMARLFQGCTSLTTVPKHIFDGVYENLLSVAGLFKDSGIQTCPSLFYENQYPVYSSAHDIFSNTPITSVPTDFFNNLMKLGKIYGYNNCFKDTPNLISAPTKFVGGQPNPAHGHEDFLISDLFNGSKMLTKSGVVNDFTEFPNINRIGSFWGNNSTANLKPCTVKVKRNTETARLFENRKTASDSIITNTFNIQYV